MTSGFDRQPNKTVEKPILGRAFAVLGHSESPVSHAEGRFSFFTPAQGLDQRPKGVDLAGLCTRANRVRVHCTSTFNLVRNVKPADCPCGVLFRRLRSRLGPAQATVATAHAIARVIYKMLKYKACPEQGRRVEYDPLSVNEYQKHYEKQQIKYMKKRAAKFGYQLVPA